MAKVFAPPAEVVIPEFDDPQFRKPDGTLDFKAHWKAEEKAVEQVQELARKTNKGDLVGEVLYFGRGDGNAVYVVWSQKPLALVWMPIGDRWQIEDWAARGLNVTEVRKMVQGSKAISKLFGGK